MDRDKDDSLYSGYQFQLDWERRRREKKARKYEGLSREEIRFEQNQKIFVRVLLVVFAFFYLRGDLSCSDTDYEGPCDYYATNC